MQARYLFSLLFLYLAVLTVPASATVELSINGTPRQSPYKYLNYKISITHNEYLPNTTSLSVYIDGTLKKNIPLASILSSQQNYENITYIFDYTLTAHGTNRWQDYPELAFRYVVSASGTCGNGTQASEDCNMACYGTANPSNPFYPCSWNIQYPQELEAQISGYQGLKFIKDATSLIQPPPDTTPGSLVWSAAITQGNNIEITTRAACGGEQYPTGVFLSKSGWNSVGREIPPSLCKKIGAGATCYIEPFDDQSIQKGYKKYGGPDDMGGKIDSGGVYEIDNGNYIYQDLDSHDGSKGEIVFTAYDSDKTYVIFRLPPRGDEYNGSHRVCAYTDYSLQNSTSWTASHIFTGNTLKYGDTYTHTFTQSEIENSLSYPDCPTPDQSTCDTQVSTIEASVVGEMQDFIQISFDMNTLTVSAYAIKRMFSENHTETLNLADYSIKPSIDDKNHTLVVALSDGQVQIASASTKFSFCNDNDKDGYCEENTLCSDNDPHQHPGAKETCDGYDNDCDGLVDEDFKNPENVLKGIIPGILGEGCYDWEENGMHSACIGNWTCSSDGLNVTCNGEHQPGELKEICANGIDDDCDGEFDETYNPDGSPACIIDESCSPGDTKPCGSNIGRCVQGYRVCINGKWSECKDAIGPFDETCNNQDDDCNGVVDDVNGGHSIKDTKCGCYNGASPSSEICNDIDDDCNGKIDDGISCCTDGDTRYCGTDVGVCTRGIQTCSSGSWGPCTGGIQPTEEICYDRVDNNCNGETDEGCDPDVTCSNGVQDLNENGIDCGPACPRKCPNMLSWVLIASGALVIIVLLVLLQLNLIKSHS